MSSRHPIEWQPTGFTDTRRIAQPKAAVPKARLERLGHAIEIAYRKTCTGIQIDIMDIGKIFKAGRDAAEKAGLTRGLGPNQHPTEEQWRVITYAVVEKVAELRKN